MPAGARSWSARGSAAARQRNSSLLARARQLQALVRQRGENDHVARYGSLSILLSRCRGATPVPGQGRVLSARRAETRTLLARNRGWWAEDRAERRELARSRRHRRPRPPWE